MNHTKTKVKNSIYLIILFIITLFVLFLILDHFYPLDRQRLSKPSSVMFMDKKDSLLRIKLSQDGFWRIPAKEDEIPLLLKQSVIHFEDQYFYRHFGINIFSIFRAIYHNLLHKRIIGASTITMQVSRMMYQRKRTLSNKIIEIFNALQLEWHYSKAEILAYYFNLAPYGGNIEGVKSAALFYFQKPLQELSISQIAILTSIPKNPNINRPDRQKDLTKKRDIILQKLLNHHLITKEQYKRAKKEPITSKRLKVPFYAPNFTNMIKTNKAIIHTTLDLSLQSYTKERLRQQLQKLRHFDVHNASALIIHNPTMQILAYIGSANFFDVKHDGQNNGITMIRSPGSTLKPFIYAKALEKGFITPNQELYDIDLFLQGYTPKNFNKRFTGRISAKEALQYSLNIPAVTLNHLLKQNSLYELLKYANIKSIDHPKSYYGDAIALGGCGISLMDLTLLYTSLANGGILKKPSYILNRPQQQTKKLFLKPSTYLISTILADASRIKLSSYWDSSRDIPKVAFKTGTSARARDLLTVGYTPEYTVGVWFGNFNAHKTKNLTGLQTASEVVLDIFEHLNQKSKLTWFKKPAKIITKKRCVDAIKQKNCKTYIEDMLIKGVTPSPPCELIRAETFAYLIKNKDITSMADLKDDHCYNVWKDYNPLITTPADHAKITQNSLLPDNLNELKFNCYSFEENQTIYWFIDDKKQIRTTSGKPLFIYLPEGNHQISCLDMASKISTHEINILKN